MAGRRRLRPVEGLLAPAVSETVQALPARPEDSAAVRLAERYAAQIDEAHQIAAELAEIVPAGDDQARRLDALTKRVEAHTVLSELGPRLLAVLVELGATPKARGQKAPAAGPSRLAALRESRGA
ncbi:MAG TPA: hypothetical protein VGD67_13720 [Pseudonocardiaceae bacterium]